MSLAPDRPAPPGARPEQAGRAEPEGLAHAPEQPPRRGWDQRRFPAAGCRPTKIDSIRNRIISGAGLL